MQCALTRRMATTNGRKAIDRELSGVDQYETFEDLGHRDNINPPRGHQRIKLMWTFAVKHDGRFKARLCARGDMTEEPIKSVYSGVVTIRGIRMVMFRQGDTFDLVDIDNENDIKHAQSQRRGE